MYDLRGSFDVWLHHHQGARRTPAFARETASQVFDDLVAERLAARAPPPGAGHGLDASPQPAKTKHLGRFPELAADGIAKRSEEDQLTALIRAGKDLPEIHLGHADGSFV